MYNLEFEKVRKLSIATTNGILIDNTIVNVVYYNNAFIFGAFDYTTKCKFIDVNSLAALTFSDFQIHSLCRKLEKTDPEFNKVHEKYKDRFKSIQKLIEYPNNNYYVLKPLVIWKYNYKTNSRDTVILNEKYYDKLNPYDNIKYK